MFFIFLKYMKDVVEKKKTKVYIVQDKKSDTHQCSCLVASLVALTVKYLPAVQEPWAWKFPWRTDRLPTPVFLGFPDGSDGQRICLQCGRPGFSPWVGKIPWKRTWQPISVFLPGEFHGQRSLGGYSSQSHKELYTTEVTQHTLTHGQKTLSIRHIQLSKKLEYFFKKHILQLIKIIEQSQWNPNISIVDT